MLIAYLANSGGEVVIPDAVETTPGETDALIHFVDQNGRILATFRRTDLLMLTHDSSLFAEPGGTDGDHANAKAT